MLVTRAGMAAPTAKLAADVNAAWRRTGSFVDAQFVTGMRA
jgi:hypothetical protein